MTASNNKSTSSSQSAKDGAKEGPKDDGKPQRPRDAATLVLVDTSSGEPRMLMGKRRATQIFMPNKVVFPGGRVDSDDRLAESADELTDNELAKLLLEMKGHQSPARARSMALAAIRETFEETGVIIGRAVGQKPTTTVAGWQTFYDQGYLPTLAGLSLFARAITPPGRTRRYDTRFFCASIEEVAAQTGEFDDELSEISWYSIGETADLDLPPITRVIIEDLGDRLKAGPLGPLAAPIPFYHQRSGTFRRDLLST
ncbi:MAG: 8-oxo-dGTP pyrophosphatase MutT (NUDIX family) [Hyphomicrobiaceae bacterium]|jgi:8-oxo-dGTP pyrophosphatase MutT (NUDIX family)